VGFWFSFSSEVVVCMGLFSMNTSAVSGSASKVLPMNECKSGPCSVPGWLKTSMVKGCMSGAMLPNRSAGRYA